MTRLAIIVRLALANSASNTIGGIYTPFFSAWLLWRGFHPAEIGALLSLGMVIRVLTSPMSGIVADARNDRRSTMIALYGVMLLCYSALLVITAPLAIFALVVVGAIAGGAASPLLESVTLRMSERWKFSYGPVRAWGSATFVACNVIAGVAISTFGMTVMIPWLVVSLAFNIFAIWILPAPPTDRPRHDFRVGLHTTMAQARELLRSRTFLLFLIAAGLDQGSHAVYYNFGAPNWLRLGYPGWMIGVLWPLGVVIEVALLAFSMRVYNTFGAAKLLILGCASCVLRWTIMAFDPPLSMVVFAQLLHGGTFALAHLGAMYFILAAVPPRLAATAQSLYAVGTGGIFMGLATFAAGPLYAAYHGRVYLMMSAMALVGLAFAFLLQRAWHGGRLTTHPEEEDHGFI